MECLLVDTNFLVIIAYTTIAAKTSLGTVSDAIRSYEAISFS